MVWRGLARYRKADKAHGDDTTLTRFVRDDGDGPPKRTRQRQPRMLGIGAAPAFVEEGRTKFGSRVLSVDDQPSLLVSGHANVKIGRDVRKGKFRGYWIYTLALEERATCPRSCEHWQSCYGNNMPFAKRVDHTDPKFLPALEAEIERLLDKHRKTGILVRLHALGDFYSVDYLMFWRRMLIKHPRLAIYGYTARLPETPIGREIVIMLVSFKSRFAMRFSNGGAGVSSTVTIMDPADRPDDAFVCPEQTGQTRCCATCGACWSTFKNVAFLQH